MILIWFDFFHIQISSFLMQQFQQKIRSAYKSKFVLPLPTQQKTKKKKKYLTTLINVVIVFALLVLKLSTQTPTISP